MTARQVLIPGTNKTGPHPWRITLAVARGEILNKLALVEEAYAEQQAAVQHKMNRHGRRIRRYFSGGTPYRNPKRVGRLRRNGRLRKELR